MSLFRINVRNDSSDKTRPFRLYNHDWPAGDRHVQQDGFPLPLDRDWTRYSIEAEANIAAGKLQKYLDKSPEAKNAAKHSKK